MKFYFLFHIMWLKANKKLESLKISKILSLVKTKLWSNWIRPTFIERNDSKIPLRWIIVRLYKSYEQTSSFCQRNRTMKMQNGWTLFSLGVRRLIHCWIWMLDFISSCSLISNYVPCLLNHQYDKARHLVLFWRT